MAIELTRAPDAHTAAVTAAALIGDGLRRGLDARPRATLALSGGRSPLPLFDALAAITLEWPRVDVLQVDERAVDLDDPDRNLAPILDRLIRPTGARVHPLDVTDAMDAATLTSTAATAAETLRSVAGSPPVLDVVHLGLGADGHTASWPSGADLDDHAGPVAVVRGFHGHDRLTLTPAVVDDARLVVWFVVDADRRDVLGRLLRRDPSIAATRVRAPHQVVVTTLDPDR